VTRRGRRRDNPGIDRVTIEGYKSLRTRQEIEIRPLTVLAGVNSSGKSSAMQPLLLLKQTLETPYDPGPLQLSGPSVDVTEIEQVLARGAGRGSTASEFTFGVGVRGQATEWTFGKDQRGDLRVRETAIALETDPPRTVALREGMSPSRLRELIPEIEETRAWSASGGSLTVVRDRFFLVPGLRIDHETVAQLPQFIALTGSHATRAELTRVIHLPALRGNPRRTYRTVAVEDRFPGTFDTYTAGVIAAWQNRKQTDELEQLRADLQELRLTWKVTADKVNDTEVTLMVGRLPSPQRGGARDLVNIADVGFGVSQTLPVVVALLVARPGQLVYLEQPEIHLHPRAQVAFANLLKRAVERRVRVVVETHSSLLIRSLQTLVAREELRTDDIVLHWFTRAPQTGDTQIATAELDRTGAFGDWPEDFDEVQLETEAGYLDAAAEAANR
jgi:hypothetical protein